MRFHIICSVYDQTGEVVTWIDGHILREPATFKQCQRVRRKLFHTLWEGNCEYCGTQAGPNFGFLPY